MTPADRDLLGRTLVDHGWEPDGYGWYSPCRAWHVDAGRGHLVLSRRGRSGRRVLVAHHAPPLAARPSG